MKQFSLILACLALLADAHTTYRGLLVGHTEMNPIRRGIIRAFGLRGGTYGLALAVCFGALAVNLWSHQPDFSMILGNLILAAGFGAAAWYNLRRL